LNNLTAQIRTVDEIPVILTESDFTPGTGGSPGFISTTQTITIFNVGTILTVTPTINQDGTITIAMQPLVADRVGEVEFGGGGGGDVEIGVVPLISTQQIDTISNVKDGETLAIGGLRRKNNLRQDSRIPILGSIPIIGRLFRGKRDITTESELIIFVTARIVRRIDDPVSGT
jgi:type II secretory pathway component GspD/PulD (secretin)